MRSVLVRECMRAYHLVCAPSPGRHTMLQSYLNRSRQKNHTHVQLRTVASSMYVRPWLSPPAGIEMKTKSFELCKKKGMHQTPTRSAARQITTHHGSGLALPQFLQRPPEHPAACAARSRIATRTHAYVTQCHVCNKTDPSSDLGAPRSGGEPLFPVSVSRLSTPSPIPPRGVLGVVRPLRLCPSPLSPKRSGRLLGDRAATAGGPPLPLVSTSATSFATFSCITASSSSGSADRRPFPAACSEGEWSGVEAYKFTTEMKQYLNTLHTKY